MFYVYEIRNKKTNYRYIGCSKDYQSRWKEHLRDLRKNQHHCLHLQRAWNKYGENLFKFNLLSEHSTEHSMFLEEIETIQNTRRKYNIAPGGIGGNTRKNFSVEQKDELRKKLSEAQKKRYMKEGEREKANVFRGLSEEERVLRIEKWKKAKQGKNNPNFTYNQKVLQILPKTGEIIKTWENACTASHEGGYTLEYILKCCKGKKGYNTHKGFIWKWEENPEN